jgi:RNA polymerase sigma factor (sigma-70 family)
MDDQKIWSALKKGSSEALEEIYRSQVDFLLQYGLRFTRDESLVEDCMHDLFVDLWRNRRGLGEPQSIRAYLLVALRRSIIKQLKKKQRTTSEQEPEEIHFRAEVAVDEMIIAAEMEEEQIAALASALQTLPDRQREALYLRYYQEMDYQDICQIMEIGYQSVRNLVASGIRSLRGILQFLLFWIFFLGGSVQFPVFGLM